MGVEPTTSPDHTLRVLAGSFAICVTLAVERVGIEPTKKFFKNFRLPSLYALRVEDSFLSVFVKQL